MSAAAYFCLGSKVNGISKWLQKLANQIEDFLVPGPNQNRILHFRLNLHVALAELISDLDPVVQL